MSDNTENTKQPTLNGNPVTPEQLHEEKEKLPGNQRIVEINPGEHRKLTRLQG